MLERHAVVGEAGRDVQYVARQELDVDHRLEGIGVQQGRVGRELAVFAALAHAPAPPPGTLADEHVVQVDMRPHPAARRGVADHHVVQAPFRQEGKRFHQGRHFRPPVIHGLHDQRPAALAQMLIRFERPPFGLPLLVLFVDQTRFDLFLACQAGQLIGADRVGKKGEALAYHHRFLLPIMFEEVFDGKIGQMKFKHGAQCE